MSAHVIGCASMSEATEDHRERSGMISPAASVAELSGVWFLRGRPRAGDTLEQSLAAPVSLHLRGLAYDAELLKNYPEESAEVTGHTDDHECSGVVCNALALRRAELVYAWLISNGVRGEQLKSPVGFGDTAPISFNSTEKDRANNRRVELNLMQRNYGTTRAAGEPTPHSSPE